MGESLPAMIWFHYNVESDRIGLEFGCNIQSLLWLFAQRHMVATRTKLRVDELGGRPIILNHQNSLCAEGSRRSFRFAALCFSDRGRRRQREIKATSLSYLTVTTQLSPMYFNHTLP